MRLNLEPTMLAGTSDPRQPYRIPGNPALCAELAGAGPLVLFLHGIGGNRTNWQAQLPAFARHFFCIAWDARGYGDSEDYEGPLAFDDFAADVVRVLDHFESDRAHLVGLSMGGRIAMRTALLYPHRVATLTLADTHEGFASFSPEQRREFVDMRCAPLRAGKQPRDIAETVARSLTGPSATSQQLKQLIASIAALHKESYIKTVEASVAQTQPIELGRIRAPAHFIVGADDRLTPPEVHRKMAAALGGAPVSVLADAGHLSNIENSAAFNEAALQWLLPRASLASPPRRGRPLR